MCMESVWYAKPSQHRAELIEMWHSQWSSGSCQGCPHPLMKIYTWSSFLSGAYRLLKLFSGFLWVEVLGELSRENFKPAQVVLSFGLEETLSAPSCLGEGEPWTQQCTQGKSVVTQGKLRFLKGKVLSFRVKSVVTQGKSELQVRNTI